MTCTPDKNTRFQYEEGKKYEEEIADACSKGFHACELPIDAFRYYSPVKSVYHKVEMSGKFDKSESDKVCSSKIKIGARISIAGIIKASIDIIRNKAEKEFAASSGNYGNAASSAYKGNAASSGNCGSAKADHENSCAIAWGPMSKARGVIGSHLVLAEWKSNGGLYWEEETWEFKGANMVQVDGKEIKENTWYTLKNGEIVESEEK